MLFETCFPGQQVAGARSVQSNLHDDRIGVGKQYPTNKTLPESYTEARECANGTKKAEEKHSGTVPCFFFVFIKSHFRCLDNAANASYGEIRVLTLCFFRGVIN